MTEFITLNPDLALGAIVILFTLLLIQTVRAAIHKMNCLDLAYNFNGMKAINENQKIIIDNVNDENFDLQTRLADAEQIINALSGRVIKIRDEQTQQYVSYKDIKNKILQYENKYYKKNKPSSQ